MLEIKLNDGILEIHESTDSLEVLGKFLREQVASSEMVYHFDQKRYSRCKQLMKECHENNITTIKLHQWDKTYLALLVGIIAQEHPHIQALMGRYLTLLPAADTKYKIETLVFSLAQEYGDAYSVKFKDEHLEFLLEHIVKAAKSSRTACVDETFVYRPVIREQVYGSQVLDMQAIFKFPDALVEPQKPDDSLLPQ